MEPRYLFNSDWQNPVLHRDVDRSDLVTAFDALLIINRLNLSGPHSLVGEVRRSTDMDWDVNGDSFIGPIDALMVINALNALQSRPATIVGGIAPESDPNGNRVVLDPHIIFRGSSVAGSKIEVWDRDRATLLATTTANPQGQYQIPLTLSNGITMLDVLAKDDLGRRSQLEMEVVVGNVVHEWNAAALDIVRQWTTFSNDPYPNRIVYSQPPMVARNLAMIHAAMFDALNAFDGQYASYVDTLTPSGDLSKEVAAAAAAHVVASSLYSASDELPFWDATLFESTRLILDENLLERSLEYGRSVGQAVLDRRSHDGAKTPGSYAPSSDVGHWRRTSPDYLPPLLPNWPKVEPFGLVSPTEFRPESPPALGSEEYADAVHQVQLLGSLDSQIRTSEQTEIALFWADGGGTFTPPGHWNKIASDVSLERSLGVVETARAFALLNFALADAGIASWDAKYYFDLWRPIDAIRQGEVDGNKRTEGDPNWIPLLKTPPFRPIPRGTARLVVPQALCWLDSSETIPPLRVERTHTWRMNSVRSIHHW